MITLSKIPFSELNKYVSLAYIWDEDMLNQYHVKSFKFEDAVDQTLHMIKHASQEESVDMAHYRVVLDVTNIGYLCIFSNNLYSFGINKHFRTKEILPEFWSRIVELLGNSFITLLYPNNTRAIGWLKKCGMVEVCEVEDNCTALIYHKV